MGLQTSLPGAAGPIDRRRKGSQDWLGACRALAVKLILECPAKRHPILVVAMLFAWLLPAPHSLASPPVPLPKPSEVRNIGSRERHSQPAPRPGGLQSELEHRARYDEAIQSVLALTLTGDDAKTIKAAFEAIGVADGARAQALAGQLTSSTQRRLVRWYALFRGLGSGQDHHSFIKSNPDWPGRRILRRRLEAALFESSADPARAEGIVRDLSPISGAGVALQAAAALANKNEKAAVALARRAWRDFNFTRRSEKLFLERFKEFLRPQDHRWRIDRLLGAYVRWRSQRSGRASAVLRTARFLSKQEQAKVNFRVSAFRESRRTSRLWRKLPDKKVLDWGLEFNRVQWLRRSGKISKARKILLRAPTDPKIIADLNGWWQERVFSAYHALKAGKPKIAYELVKEAGPLDINAANAQAFLSGWLALRHLNLPNDALAHFTKLEKGADGPLSRSRAAYWLGRTYDALGQPAKARQKYLMGAKIIDTFDGHLSRLKLGAGAGNIDIKLPVVPTKAQIVAFNRDQRVRAAVIASKAGLSPRVVRRFLNTLRFSLKSEAELAMLAHLAQELGDTQMAVRIGKTANARGHNLIIYSYPMRAFPAYSPLRPPPETALLLAIARQESEFNTLTVSGAGARGLMQVMPITARHVCRVYKLKCNVAKLSTDKTYNTAIASAYIGDRLKEFDGSYVLSIAGYNAGPARVRQWTKDLGDPRLEDIDPVDWIHSIPFGETRLYVQKVLSNVQIYRARLADSPIVTRLQEDLNRTTRVASSGRP